PEIPRAIHEAFHLARSGRPGPVLVDIPQDLSRAEIEYEPVTDVRLPGYQPRVEGNQKQIRQAAKALASAQRPVIYAGGGVINANASQELTEFVLSDRFPITCTLMGLGAFAAPHPQWLGMLGMHGTRAANYAMDEADLICAVGARFDDRITGKLSEFAPRAKFIHIDVDPAEISMKVPAQYYHVPKPRRWVNSGGVGTMGFGLPAAMGAAVGCPDQLVRCVAGDGSVQMNAQELATCSENDIPIKVFIMNNGYLGMVRQW